MQQLVSAMTGTTPTGRPRKFSSSCCSTEAKKELKSTKKLGIILPILLFIKTVKYDE
jgi:hypothetical protein